MSSHDGGAVSKASGVCSPAVALPHQPFYRNSDVHSPARFGVANYSSVVPGGLPYKQVRGFLMLVLLLQQLVLSFFNRVA